mmetsp:Transcript_28998/g.75928  ORF Transcript_28998/g.75928 Transcript_28998/m.75928 type:complete len:220 (-) Transcript_28998:854-1513(-)
MFAVKTPCSLGSPSGRCVDMNFAKGSKLCGLYFCFLSSSPSMKSITFLRLKNRFGTVSLGLSSSGASSSKPGLSMSASPVAAPAGLPHAASSPCASARWPCFGLAGPSTSTLVLVRTCPGGPVATSGVDSASGSAYCRKTLDFCEAVERPYAQSSVRERSSRPWMVSCMPSTFSWDRASSGSSMPPQWDHLGRGVSGLTWSSLLRICPVFEVCICTTDR